MAYKYDCLWYWKGGREVGEWREVLVGPSEIAAATSGLRAAGYATHRGSTKIGPPEGPPHDDEFKALGTVNLDALG